MVRRVARVLRGLTRPTAHRLLTSLPAEGLLDAEGGFPVRSFVLTEGARFPLGVASAGLAILAFAVTPGSTPTWGPRRSGPRAVPGTPRRRSSDDASGTSAWAQLTGSSSGPAPSGRPGWGAQLLEQAHLLSQALTGVSTVRRGR